MLGLQGDPPEVLDSLFEKMVKVYEYNKGSIIPTTAQQIWPCTKHIEIGYHHFHSFIAKCDLSFEHIYKREKVKDIFTKPLGDELFYYLCLKLNVW